MRFGIGAMESNPHLVQIVPPNEVVVVIGFEVKLGGRAGTMSLCMPYNVIEPVMEALNAESWLVTGSGDASSADPAIVRGYTSAMQVRRPSRGDHPLELGGLEVDLITTDRLAHEPVTVSVEAARCRPSSASTRASGRSASADPPRGMPIESGGEGPSGRTARIGLRAQLSLQAASAGLEIVHSLPVGP